MIKKEKIKFNILANYIAKKDKNLGKKISKIKFKDKNSQKILSSVLKILNVLLKSYKLNLSNACEAYVELCRETLKEQFYLKKNNTYRSINENINNLNLYNSYKKMKSYLVGLLLTQIFWSHHTKILLWFLKNIQKNHKIKNYLEIGAGHGLFSVILKSQKNINGTILDISSSSINILKKVFKKIKMDRDILFIKKDFLRYKTKNKFDFIIMGEVIEHVKKPINFLKKSKNLLNNQGQIFLTTCANCAQHDHLFHFKNITHIKKIIKQSGLSISKELIIPSEKLPKIKWKKEKISISYCAFLKKTFNI